MEKFKSVIRDYPFIAFIIAFVILAFVPSVVFTDVYQSHLATLIFVNIVVAAGLNIVKGYCCLLYTSPSPRDQRGSRMPSSA